ncbi:response regulator [Parerythrobacter aestuarii]|uniref:response regulator n=1 Tax=Parerythrobacter aestuarii TaxID=3020909 RepID=UPI0024DE1F0C|nr:response regulator [Parerythrobacter aestuarii]
MKEVPAKDWVRDASGKQPSAGDAAAPAKLRVLLAEDTAISAEMMQAMADRLSIDMDIAANGLEAIDMVHAAIDKGEPYSLLLVDIMMPILDGIETARRLRSEGINTVELPIIAITAATELDEVRIYRKAGMQAFLEKPVALADLRATLHAWGHGTKNRAQKLRSAAFEALNEQFSERKVSTLKALRDALASDDLSESVIVELRRILHQLAGTAGSFGETALGEEARAHEIELMATYFEGGDVRDILERAAQSIARKI